MPAGGSKSSGERPKVWLGRKGSAAHPAKVRPFGMNGYGIAERRTIAMHFRLAARLSDVGKGDDVGCFVVRNDDAFSR